MAAARNDDIEEGEIDEAFWVREDEVEARRQLLWANAAPLVWGAAPLKPQAGSRVEGDVRWPRDGAAASVLPNAGPATAQQPGHKRKASAVEEASEASAAAEPEEQKKREKKEKKEKKAKKEKREKTAKKERREPTDEESE